MRRAAIAALALLLASCAQNAVLELQLMLPPQGAGPQLYALVQVRRAADHPFDVEWRGEEIDAVELSGEETRVQISVIGRDPEVDLHVKVRFCRVPSCDDLGDPVPEVWYAIEHPFYVGRRTAWAACVPLATDRPTAPIVVDRCEIHGCVRGMGSTSYCEGAGSGAHFCETGSIDEPPADLRCVLGSPTY